MRSAGWIGTRTHSGTYLVKLSGRELNHTDSQSVNTLLHTISDFERASATIPSTCWNPPRRCTRRKSTFSKDAQEELQVLEDAVQDTLSRTTDAFRKGGSAPLLLRLSRWRPWLTSWWRAIKARHVPPAGQLLHRVTVLCWTIC